jgi:parvulin-like peptidyl-prolyl isomerase
LQRAADLFRHRHGLTSAAETQRWLDAAGITIEEFEAVIVRDLLISQYKHHLTQPRVAEHFAAHRNRYAQAQLRRIVVDSEELARELMAQLTDEGRDFAELARQHSLDGATRRAGGSMGLVRRAEMPADVAAAVFGAKAGHFVGPVAVEGSYLLYLVEELPEPTLDEATAALIRDELFAAWVREQSNAVQIDLSWLQSTNDYS